MVRAPTGWRRLERGLVRMAVDPKNAATYKILTPENNRVWAAGQTYEPVGRGADYDAFGGDRSGRGVSRPRAPTTSWSSRPRVNEGGYKLSVQ